MQVRRERDAPATADQRYGTPMGSEVKDPR